LRIPVNWSQSESEFLEPEDQGSPSDSVECSCCGGDDFQYYETIGYYICRRCSCRIEESDMERAASGITDD
jgi:hypothetical protein